MTGKGIIFTPDYYRQRVSPHGSKTNQCIGIYLYIGYIMTEIELYIRQNFENKI